MLQAGTSEGFLQRNLTWFAMPSPFPAGQVRQQVAGLDRGGWWPQKGTSQFSLTALETVVVMRMGTTQKAKYNWILEKK